MPRSSESSSSESNESCPICCNDYDLVETPKSWSAYPCHVAIPLACGHSFCEHCLLQHLKTKIDDKNSKLLCPSSECPESIPSEVEKRLLECYAPHYKIKLEKLRLLALNPSLVECPHCDSLTQPLTKQGNNVTCTKCRGYFCLVHGTSHPGETCEVFMASPRSEALRLSEEALDRLTKPCTRCGARLQRSNGCDYVVCGNCRQDFCWKCSTHEHIEGDMRRQCTKCKSIAHGVAPERVGCCRTLCGCTLFLLAAIAWPMFALVFLILTGCWGCCFCGFKVETDKPRQPGRAMLSLLIVECFPLMCCLDALYSSWMKQPEGFIAPTLPPEWSSFAEEIPFATVGGGDHSNTEQDDTTGAEV